DALPISTRSGRWERPTSGHEGARRGAPRVLASQGQEPDERGGSGVRDKRIWARLLGLGKAVVEGVEVAAGGAIVIAVRPRFTQRDRCPHCRRRCPGYDLGEGRRCWRALDLGTTFCFVEADAPRVSCQE